MLHGLLTRSVNEVWENIERKKDTPGNFDTKRLIRIRPFSPARLFQEVRGPLSGSQRALFRDSAEQVSGGQGALFREHLLGAKGLFKEPGSSFLRVRGPFQRAPNPQPNLHSLV